MIDPLMKADLTVNSDAESRKRQASALRVSLDIITASAVC